MINENLYDKNGGLIFTHVGQIIHSTTLDTEDKVKAIYGGIRWQKIEGRFLLGQSSSHAINSVGGEENHILTVNEMPSHGHDTDYLCNENLGGATGSEYSPWSSVHFIYGSGINKNGTTQTLYRGSYFKIPIEIKKTGQNTSHNNMPPYKVVYIWERIK